MGTWLELPTLSACPGGWELPPSCCTCLPWGLGADPAHCACLPQGLPAVPACPWGIPETLVAEQLKRAVRSAWGAHLREAAEAQVSEAAHRSQGAPLTPGRGAA